MYIKKKYKHIRKYAHNTCMNVFGSPIWRLGSNQYVLVCINMYRYVFVHIRMYYRNRMYTYVCVCMWMNQYVLICICTYVCVCVHMHSSTARSLYFKPWRLLTRRLEWLVRGPDHSPWVDVEQQTSRPRASRCITGAFRETRLMPQVHWVGYGSSFTNWQERQAAKNATRGHDPDTRHRSRQVHLLCPNVWLCVQCWATTAENPRTRKAINIHTNSCKYMHIHQHTV